jgi:outer membrane receptor protein involved in Fe transport
VQDAPGEPIIDLKDTFAGFGLAGGGQFDYKLTTNFGYNFGGGKASVGMQWRYLPEIRDEAAARTPNTNVSGVDSDQSFNLYTRYAFNERFQLLGGIDNLLDEQPPIVGSRPGDRNAENTRPDYYDILGRRMYLGLKMNF